MPLKPNPANPTIRFLCFVVLVGEALVRDQEPRRAVADMIAAGTLARSQA